MQNEIFATETTFADLGLTPEVLQSLTELGWTHPTHIQAQLIPPALAGKDLLGQAKTGTGKTAAFALPIMTDLDPAIPAQALILAPTRELALQISREIETLGKFTDFKTVCIVGGESMGQQISKLEKGAQIIVGTPGRVQDLYNRRKLSFDNLRYAILDEVDRMLDIGFRDDIRKILSQIKADHQTIFVSATISPEIESLARQFMKKDAEKIVTTTKSLTVSQVTQHYIHVKPWDKRSLLTHLLKHEEPALTVVFCRMKVTVRDVTRHLQQHGIDAFEIHGDLNQAKRNKIMERLREGKLEVLVASDLASRGLDVEGITHVINYDLPEDPEVYVHRIGRTARAGRKGVAWSLVEPGQGQMLTEIEKLTAVLIDRLDYPEFAHREDPPAGSRYAQDKPKERAPAEPRYTTSTPDEEALADTKKFPSGIKPTGTPRPTLGSRFRTKRGRR